MEHFWHSTWKTPPRSNFKFEDLKTKDVRVISVSDFDEIKCLDYAIKEILYASTFDSWDKYCEHKRLVSMKDENEKLKAEIEKLKTEIKQLKEKLLS